MSVGVCCVSNRIRCCLCLSASLARCVSVFCLRLVFVSSLCADPHSKLSLELSSAKNHDHAKDTHGANKQTAETQTQHTEPAKPAIPKVRYAYRREGLEVVAKLTAADEQARAQIAQTEIENNQNNQNNENNANAPTDTQTETETHTDPQTQTHDKRLTMMCLPDKHDSTMNMAPAHIKVNKQTTTDEQTHTPNPSLKPFCIEDVSTSAKNKPNNYTKHT